MLDCGPRGPEFDTPGQLLSPVFITTVGTLLVLVCVLLFVIRALKTRHNRCENQSTADTSAVAMNQLLDRNEVPSATEKDVCVSTDVLRQERESNTAETNSTSLLSSELNSAEGDGKNSAVKKEEGTEVIYSNVIWKSKKKKKAEDSGDVEPSCSSYMEEERCMVGDVCRNFVSDAVDMGNQYDEGEPKTVKSEAECEYAQVKFKDKPTKHQ